MTSSPNEMNEMQRRLDQIDELVVLLRVVDNHLTEMHNHGPIPLYGQEDYGALHQTKKMRDVYFWAQTVRQRILTALHDLNGGEAQIAGAGAADHRVPRPLAGSVNHG